MWHAHEHRDTVYIALAVAVAAVGCLFLAVLSRLPEENVYAPAARARTAAAPLPTASPAEVAAAKPLILSLLKKKSWTAEEKKRVAALLLGRRIVAYQFTPAEEQKIIALLNK